MDTGYSLSDIATATGRNDGYGWGDNSFMWIFALLILANGGFGWGGNRFNGNPVTEADLCNANSFSELKNSVGRLNDNLTNTYIGLQNGLCNLGYTNLENFNATQRQIADCCCTTQQSILKMGYENQLAIQGQTESLNRSLNFVNSSIERGFSALGFQNAQDKCEIIRAGQDNTQRIIDTLNCHWNSDLQQRYNDARLELSQQKQNAALIAALKTTTTPTT